MRGIVYVGDGKAELTDELTVRDPGPGEVLVRLVASGLCHTDISVLDGTIPWPAPSVLGHEGAGVVEQIGEGVTLVAVGDHIVLSTIANCGMCRMCNTGHPTRCRQSIGNRAERFLYKGQPAGNFAGTSTLAEYTVIRELQAVKIDKDVPLTSACLIACGVMTGAGSVWNGAQVQRGDTAAVWGARRCGPERDPGARRRRRVPDHRHRHPRPQGSAGPRVRRDPLRARRRRRPRQDPLDRAVQ